MKVLRAIPNPVNLGKVPVGFRSDAEISKVTISEGATFIEDGLVSFITEEFEVIRKAGVQHLHLGYSFESGQSYYVDREGELTTEYEPGMIKAGVGTYDNGLLIGFRVNIGDFVDEYGQFFVDENGFGFKDPSAGDYVVFIDDSGILLLSSYEDVFSE